MPGIIDAASARSTKQSSSLVLFYPGFGMYYWGSGVRLELQVGGWDAVASHNLLLVVLVEVLLPLQL